jgi:hypothetical protein
VRSAGEWRVGRIDEWHLDIVCTWADSTSSGS